MPSSHKKKPRVQKLNKESLQSYQLPRGGGARKPEPREHILLPIFTAPISDLVLASHTLKFSINLRSPKCTSL